MDEASEMKEEHIDYKEMYLKMVRASEQAIRILIEAQQECEEMYLNAAEPQKPDEAESEARR